MKYLENGIEVDGKFYSLKEITENCNKQKIKKSKMVLLTMEWDRRGGNAYEQLLLPKKDALKLKSLMLGKEIYFGEIWGKHSEVYGEMEEYDFTISEKEDEISNFLLNHPNGSDSNHSFIDALIDEYHDNGGREYYEEEQGKKYCNDIEAIEKLIYPNK